jgi:phage repressor protein C with HTH and peptisase S24 domain
MKSLTFLPKLRKPNILIRRVVGLSMAPTLKPGQIVFGYDFYKKLGPGTVVIVLHEGVEKIKRIARVERDRVFILGDNPAVSTDSRDFGAIPMSSVKAKVLYFTW